MGHNPIWHISRSERHYKDSSSGRGKTRYQHVLVDPIGKARSIIHWDYPVPPDGMVDKCERNNKRLSAAS